MHLVRNRTRIINIFTSVQSFGSYIRPQPSGLGLTGFRKLPGLTVFCRFLLNFSNSFKKPVIIGTNGFWKLFYFRIDRDSVKSAEIREVLIGAVKFFKNILGIQCTKVGKPQVVLQKVLI